MTAPQTSGEHRLLTRFRQAELRAQIEQHVAVTVTSNSAIDTPQTALPSRRPPRIPCIGLDSGAMPGTRPDTLAWVR